MNCSVNIGNEQTFYNFQDTNFFFESFSVMDELRQQRKLCDVILKVEDQSFSAHRNILASASPYFLTMFTNNDYPESQMKKITMNEIEPSVLESLINFAYRGEVRIDKENVRGLMVGASLLLLDRLRDACAEFLVAQLNPANILGVRNIAHSINCTRLITPANHYIRQNFSEVAMSDEFVELEFEELMAIIERDDLEAYSEEAIYEASMRWVKANQEKRVALLPQVLSKVRLPLLSVQFLVERVLKDGLIRMSFECRNLVRETINLLSGQRGDLGNSWARHCGSGNNVGKIYAVGGYNGDHGQLRSVEIYDPVTRKWRLGREMSTTRRWHGVAVVLRKLYAFGGYNAGITLSTVEVFDLNTNKWSQGREMMSKRSSAGVAVLNNLVYVCGGRGNRDVSDLNTVECFCPTTDTWRRVASMMERRWGGAAAALGGYIYVAGGESIGSELDSVEKYDPSQNAWVQVKPMIQKRSEFGLAALNGKLYACGGENENGYLKSVEVFNPAENVWKFMSPMNCKRGGLALVENMEKLWAIGGFDGESFLSSVEVYDLVTDKWSFVASISVPRYDLGAAIMGNYRADHSITFRL